MANGHTQTHKCPHTENDMQYKKQLMPARVQP